jgi:hypothetical protein
MVQYVLNKQKGTIVNHPEIGQIPGLVAVPITDKQANMCKHIRGLIVFDRVVGLNEEKVEKRIKKKIFGIDLNQPGVD